jgi:hypothetical protein
MHRRSAILVLLITALLAAACSGGGDDGASPTTIASTIPPGPGSTSSTTPGTDPALEAKAQAATLQTSDFPPGFQPQAEEPGQGLNIDLLWQELTRCLGVESNAPSAGKATSPTFLRGLATQGRSTVEYTTEQRANAVATALAGPRALECMTRSYEADVDRSKPEGATPGPVRAATREITPPPGYRALSWRINASVNLAELVVPLFQDFTVLFKAGTIIRFYYLNPGSDFPQDAERAMVEKVAARAA